uniref:Uncharacterized protein n=1 Tax=Wuchereria bancrofti TaxID=6293 RepID=A0AAF5PM82_WUCBA
MACGKLVSKKRRVIDDSFINFANEFGQRSTMLSEADRDIVCDERIWDWSREKIRKRLSFIVSKNELKWQKCNDDLCDLLLDASKTLLKNILEEALKMKRSHLMNSTGICHMFGARKRRTEGDSLTDSYVVLSMRTPLCIADIADALRVDCRFINSSSIRQQLVESTERIRKLY